MLPDGVHMHFQTKNNNLGKKLTVLQWMMLCLNGHFVYFTYGQKVNFMAILYILLSFCIFFIFGVFSRFGMLCREKSGNPGLESKT
jgi:RsiW-degrading membrane proteinase PrsW (M82 family)